MANELTNEPTKEKSTLTDYHWQRREAAQKAVAEMLKHPYSHKEVLAQTERLRNQKFEDVEKEQRE
jgi:hypothetical protein